ncbi:MAG: hypothetical protein ACRCYY_18650 [Trueperaceae bacterium]
MKQEVKTLGEQGQISLGEEFAGQHVLITQERKGVWTIKTAEVIPHDEAWIHTPENKAKLDEALAWAKENPATATLREEMEKLFAKALAQKE